MVIKVEFRDHFELEDQENCKYDFLEVRDGKYGYSKLIGKFCRAFPFPEITSSSRYLWLHFHSDNSIQGIGFRAVWSMVNRPISKKILLIFIILIFILTLSYFVCVYIVTSNHKFAAKQTKKNFAINFIMCSYLNIHN